MDKKPAPTIRDLYPNLSDHELAEAEENIERYLALVLRIYERIQTDPENYLRFCALTENFHAVSCKTSNPLSATNTKNLS